MGCLDEGCKWERTCTGSSKKIPSTVGEKSSSGSEAPGVEGRDIGNGAATAVPLLNGVSRAAAADSGDCGPSAVAAASAGWLPAAAAGDKIGPGAAAGETGKVGDAGETGETGDAGLAPGGATKSSSGGDAARLDSARVADRASTFDGDSGCLPPAVRATTVVTCGCWGGGGSLSRPGRGVR